MRAASARPGCDSNRVTCPLLRRKAMPPFVGGLNPLVLEENELSVVVLEQSRGEIADLTVRGVRVLLHCT